jgi:uncharacterized RDD family membrane protein YckC
MTDSPQRWAGERLGLPQSGSGSLAKMPRRILAIAIDWAAAMLISHAFFHDANAANLGVFAIMQLALTSTLGFSMGHRFAGIRLVNLRTGGRVTFLSAAIRTALLCLVIPVAIWDSDNRGLHDKAAGTALVRF